jgi:hypothetical protein
MTSDNLRQVLPAIDGFLAAKQGQAAAAAAYVRSHPGPNAQAEFTTMYNQAYDPRVYQFMSMPSAQAKAQFDALPKADQAALARKSQQLQAMGALQ